MTNLCVLALSPLQEDHDALRDIFRHSNWRLLEAGSWEEALRLMRLFNVDVLMLEERMPEGRWSELRRELNDVPHCPIVIVTASQPTRTLWSETINGGADCVLSKPFDATEVLHAIPAAARLRNHHHMAAVAGA